jgi:transcriptional regulator with XRE-family HTH domain
MELTYDLLRKGLAARLIAARKKAGLSQAIVAEHLDISRPSLSEIESGRRKVAAEELILLSKLYNVSLDWLASNTI